MSLAPDKYINFKLLDKLIESNISFAVFRLPKENELRLIVQNSTIEDIYYELDELNNQSGFVIAPFHADKKSPIVLISPEIDLYGSSDIVEYLEKYVSNSSRANESAEEINATNFEEYKINFELFKSAVFCNKFEKLVLSRACKYKRKKDFSSGETFGKALAKYTSNFVYLCNTPITGCWLGSSPELLLSGCGKEWETIALAGTRNSEKSGGEWDSKNINEQHIVANYMQQQLTKAGYTFSQSELSAIESGGLSHLKTGFKFMMNETSKVGSLLNLLHPSPAICGYPKEESFNFIINNEGYSRGYYSGFLGCMNMDGKTDIYVNLRCMQIKSESLTLFAGGGILPDSILDSEWEESENKMQTMLSVI